MMIYHIGTLHPMQSQRSESVLGSERRHIIEFVRFWCASKALHIEGVYMVDHVLRDLLNERVRCASNAYQAVPPTDVGEGGTVTKVSQGGNG